MTETRIDPNKQPGLTIDQILLVSAEFRHREDFLVLPPDTKFGEVSIVIETRAMQKPDGSAAGIFLLARTNDAPEIAERALYGFRVEMLALVSVSPGQSNFPPLEFVAGSGVATLFPFLRETVANLTMRGRFGPLWLKPVNVRLTIAGLSENIKEDAAKPRRLIKKKRKTAD